MSWSATSRAFSPPGGGGFEPRPATLSAAWAEELRPFGPGEEDGGWEGRFFVLAARESGGPNEGAGVVGDGWVEGRFAGRHGGASGSSLGLEERAGRCTTKIGVTFRFVVRKEGGN